MGPPFEIWSLEPFQLLPQLQISHIFWSFTVLTRPKVENFTMTTLACFRTDEEFLELTISKEKFFFHCDGLRVGCREEKVEVRERGEKILDREHQHQNQSNSEGGIDY